MRRQRPRSTACGTARKRTEAIKTSDIRQSFLDYFVRNQHKLVASSPVIPFNDPTILFANAGMNQFKDIFTGQRTTDFKRATSSQKCIRAGGKHNDLDNVGFTARHHTFFEMLGNFSFGDYFKEEAIKFAWDWVTNELKLPKDKLYATVYETDDDAFALWEKIAPELRGEKVIRFGKKDNFWSMGDVGPCGPCSEIHFDRGEKYGTGPGDVVNGETDRFVEIWNLVFMQYEQQPGGKQVPLPKPSVDTGAGLERIACVMQGKETNYGIDLFQNIIAAISELTRSHYKDNPTSHQVVADHIRALTFALADGAGISNEGRGYVLRRILRRAARHGRLLGAHEPFIYKLVPVLVNEMGSAYPEIKEKQDHVMRVIQVEEEGFLRTLDTGLDMFEKVAKKVRASGSTVVDGETVFKLYDTYGFPADLTEIIAHEQGLTLDLIGFEDAMKRQQDQSRAASKFDASDAVMRALLDKEAYKGKPSEFVREPLSAPARVELRTAIDQTSDAVKHVALILDKTPFYAESGGQVSDTGTISTATAELEVKAVYGHKDWRVHEGMIVRGSLEDLKASTAVTATVDAERRWDIMRNHTATHLAQAALRKVLGDHVKQSGSYVGPDRLRFDFSHHQPVTQEEIRQIEELVNEQILKAIDVNTVEMPIEEAKKSGAMALFGEKYGDTVRVVSVPGFSKELCGGTHVQNTSQIGPFFVTLETGIASGVRRIEAITGREAQKYMLEAKQFRREAANAVGRPEADALKGIEMLREENSALQKELKKVKAEMFSGGGKSVGKEEAVGALTLITHDFGDSDKDVMSGWLDTQKARNQAVVVIALGMVDGKPTYLAAASHEAVTIHKADVGQLSKELLPLFGGRGGGKPAFSQGGVAVGTKADDLFAKAKELLTGRK
ncbi:MAG: alanine--tRNA ligase [Candidatus Zixiibacteriota bacterium]